MLILTIRLLSLTNTRISRLLHNRSRIYDSPKGRVKQGEAVMKHKQRSMLVLLLLILAACGSSTPTTSPQSPPTIIQTSSAPIPAPTPTPILANAYLYKSPTEIIYLDFHNSIAIDLKQERDYINEQPCWHLYPEDDLGYTQQGDTITITAWYVNRITLFYLQPDGTLTQDNVSDSGQIIHEVFHPASRDDYNQVASQFMAHLPKCSGT